MTTQKTNTREVAPRNEDNHYCGDTQPIDFFNTFLFPHAHIANILKYLNRHPRKNGKGDLESALWYFDQLSVYPREFEDTMVMMPRKEEMLDALLEQAERYVFKRVLNYIYQNRTGRNRAAIRGLFKSLMQQYK